MHAYSSIAGRKKNVSKRNLLILDSESMKYSMNKQINYVINWFYKHNFVKKYLNTIDNNNDIN